MAGILDFLLPKEKKFLYMLQTQSDTLLEGANEFRLLVSYFNKLKKEERKERVNRIKDIEHKGDTVMGEIIDSLHDTFITPLDREDIYSLAGGMDDILDFINETAAMLLMYEVKKLPENVKEYVRILSTCCDILRGAIHHIEEFGEVNKAVRDLHNLEVEADALFSRCMEEIFKGIDDVKELIKLKDIYTLLEEATNKCNRIGIIMGNIVVKHG